MDKNVRSVDGISGYKIGDFSFVLGKDGMLTIRDNRYQYVCIHVEDLKDVLAELENGGSLSIDS